MPSLIHDSCLFEALTGQISFESDEFGVMLAGADYVPDQTLRRRVDVEAYEVSGEGYRPGGTRAEVSIDLDPDNHAIEIRLGAARWPGSKITARYAVYFKRNGGSAADDELVASIDFEEDIVATRSLFSVAESVLRIVNRV